MAFAQSKTVAARSTSNDSWKAAGFINFYLPSVGGKEKKFGAIPLKDTKPAEKELNAWLLKDVANVDKMAGGLILEFNTSDAGVQDQFDLGFVAPAPKSDAEKVGYINFYLPAKDGARRKLGYLMLKESDETVAPMLDWLLADATNVAKVAEKLIVKYQSATSTTHGFALN